MRQARASQPPDVDLLRLDRRGASETHMEGCGGPPRTVATTRGDVVGDTALHGGGGDDRDAGRSRRRRGSTGRNSSSVAFRPPQLPVEPMGQEQKEDTSSSIGIYTYKHRGDRGVDIHEIFVKKSRTRVLLSYAGVVFLLAIVCQSLLGKESLCLRSVWSITFGVLVAKCLQYKPVMKESVVIMPSFGVQLEIHFWSGAVDRRFIPIGKILKPLLNECLTPVTCYWSLALLLRDEDELKLVFQKFRPPVKMLVPIWKALCAFTDSKCANQPSAVSKPNYSEA